MNTDSMSWIEHLKFALKEGRFWLLFNALGLGGYLVVEFGMLIPRIPEEGPTGIEQTFLWLDIEYPIFAFYLGVNVTWLLLMKKRSTFLKTGLLSIWILVCVAWGVTIVCDPVAIKEINLMIEMVGASVGK